MSITVNIYYTGENGSARRFVEEMISGGTAEAIRREPGNIRYDYFYSVDDPETVLLIDTWENREAIDFHHGTPMMDTVSRLREKYNLHMRVERFSSQDEIPETDMKYIRQKSDPKFTYGYDVGVYLKKAADRLKEEKYYHWADVSQFHARRRYAIEKDDGEYHFIRYTLFSEDNVLREVMDINPINSRELVGNGDEFIKLIADDNELTVYYANPTDASYSVRFKAGLEVDRWYIERYEFRKHKTGDYSAFVQAGDRTTGASRDFFIPPQFLRGTFEEFLDKYLTLVPGEKFGLFKGDLITDEGLRSFLGF